MVAIVLVIAVVILLIAVGLGQTSPPQQPQMRSAPRDPTAELTPTELALDDPVEALLRYGTPADAARLAEQDVDLGALGYRGPSA